MSGRTLCCAIGSEHLHAKQTHVGCYVHATSCIPVCVLRLCLSGLADFYCPLRESRRAPKRRERTRISRLFSSNSDSRLSLRLAIFFWVTSLMSGIRAAVRLVTESRGATRQFHSSAVTHGGEVCESVDRYVWPKYLMHTYSI
jgi:hypothetical protein